MLQSLPHMRFTIAMLALLGAMWSSIDLHQHQDGWHQPAQCAVCSIEKAVAHGFTLHIVIQHIAPWDSLPPVNWLVEHAAITFAHFISIRAPPFSIGKL